MDLRKAFFGIIGVMLLLGVLAYFLRPEPKTDLEKKHFENNMHQMSPDSSVMDSIKQIDGGDYMNREDSGKKKSTDGTLMPQPTDRNWDETEEEHQQREAWLNTMHRTPPGLNWRNINRQELAKWSDSRTLNFRNKTGEADTFVNGQITGYWMERGATTVTGRNRVCAFDTFAGDWIIAADGGQLFHGMPNSGKWEVMSDAVHLTGAQFLQVVAVNGKKRILFSSNDKHFYYSDDNGLTFTTSNGLTNLANWGMVRNALLTNDSVPTLHLLVQEWDYVNWKPVMSVYRSFDLGETFSLDSTFSTWNAAADKYCLWAPRVGGTYILVAEGACYAKQGSMGDWQFRSNFHGTSGYRTLLSGTDETNFTVYGFNGGDLYKSSDQGNTWSHSGTGNFTETFDYGSFYCDPVDSTLIFHGAINLEISFNSGANFIQLNDWSEYYGDNANKLHADINRIQTINDGNGNATTWIHTDGGSYIFSRNPNRVNNATQTGFVNAMYYTTLTSDDGQNIYAGAQDQGLQCAYSGNDFKQVISGDYGHMQSGDGGKSLWAIYPGSFIYYPDATDYPIHLWAGMKGSGHLWMQPICIDPINPELVWVGGGQLSGGAHLYTAQALSNSIDVNEKPFDFSTSSGDHISAIAFDRFDVQTQYVLNSTGSFFHGTKNGNTWSYSETFLNDHYFYGSCIYPSKTTAGKVYVCGANYGYGGVKYSDDYGATFHLMNQGLPQTMVYQVVGSENDSFLFAATDAGPYAYSFADSLWYNLGESDAPVQNYWSVEYVPVSKTVRFGTYGRGIWDFHFGQPVYAGMPKPEPLKREVNIGPNPGEKECRIWTNKLLKQITVFDETGRQVWTSGNTKLGMNPIISAEGWEIGLYRIRVIYADGKTETASWVKSAD